MQPMRRSKIKGCTGLCRVTKAETAINNCRKVKFGGIVNTNCGKAASLRENRIFGLSIFIFAQELYCAVMKNDDLDSTPVQPSRHSNKVQQKPVQIKKRRPNFYSTFS